MFVLRSTHRALQADYDRLLEQRDDARREVRANQTATRTAAGQYTASDEALGQCRLARIQDVVKYERRLIRLARAVRAYRAELATETRRADRLQTAYDNAVGLGAQWQTRREDKPAAVKP